MNELTQSEVSRAVENLRSLLSHVHDISTQTSKELEKLAFHIEGYTGQVVTHLVEESINRRSL